MARHSTWLSKKTLWILLVLALVVGALAAPIAALADDTTPLEAAAAPLDSTGIATRAEFAMLAVVGLGLSTSSPTAPTFSDVPWGSLYYEYVEGVHASGLMQGLGGGVFGPDLSIARQQVATVLARYLSAVELRTKGYITGTHGTYATLAGWFEAEGAEQLASFADGLSIAAVHRMGVAYLAMHGIALGSNGWFNPLSSVTVGQCVSFIARSAEVAGSFTTPPPPVIVPPTVTAINPASGPYQGGTAVVITGTGFTSAATVKFGGVAATSVTFNSATSLTAVSPAGTPGSTVQVAVTTADGTSANTSADDFTYYAYSGPTITELSSNYGVPGDTISIYGTNFTTTGLEVWFGSQQVSPSKISYISANRLVVVVPSGYAGDTVRVKVVTAYGVSPNTSADDFTYYYAFGSPTITAVDPDSGWTGDIVQIYGTNFVNDGTDVYFGTEPVNPDYITYYGTTHLAVKVPVGPNGVTVRVKVVTDYGVSPNTSADDFTYLLDLGPYITSISPNHAWIGDVVTIYGHNFLTDGLEVWFGSVQLNPADIDYYSPTKLKVVVPAGYLNGQTVRVTVVTDWGVTPNSSADDFTYYVPVPEIAGFDLVQYSVSGADDWHSAVSPVFANGTYVDFRMRIVDQYGDPLPFTDVSDMSPWALWRKTMGLPMHGPLPGSWGAAPDTITTDADGFIYWYGLGGFADSTYLFMLGFGLHTGYPPYPGSGNAASFYISWAE
jgi:hypothetical protein